MPNTACVVSDELPQADRAKACDDEHVLRSNLEITKVADRSYYTEAGQVINYTVTATNAGKAKLTDVDITDSLIPNLNADWLCQINGAGPDVAPKVAESAAGEFIRCTASYTTTADDVDPVKNQDLKVNNSACAVSVETPKVCADLDIPLAKLNIQDLHPGQLCQGRRQDQLHGDGHEHRPGRPVRSGHHR